MPISRQNQRTFMRRLYAGTGMLKTVTLLKRNNDQQEGVVTAYTLFKVRRSLIVKTREPIFGDMMADHRSTWHIPRSEMYRVGLTDINPADRIVEAPDYSYNPAQVRYWQPESNTTISIKLMETHIDVPCFRVDPPSITNPPAP